MSFMVTLPIDANAFNFRTIQLRWKAYGVDSSEACSCLYGTEL